MEQIISNMISRSTNKQDNKGVITHKVQIQPLLDEGFNLNTIRQMGKKFGYRMIDTDTKISVTGGDLKKALLEFCNALQKKAA